VTNNTFENLCAGCNQSCCVGLSYLRLTVPEYERLFAQHREELIVKNNKLYYVIFTKEGHECPYFQNGACSIYDERPIECRLFPYSLRDIELYSGNKVLVTFHARTSCPRKKEMLSSRKKAKELLYSFAQEIGGDNCVVKVKYDSVLRRAINRIKKPFVERTKKAKK